MNKRETFKDAQEILMKQRSEHWLNHTVKEVAEMEGVSVGTASLWMAKFDIKPDTEVARRRRERKAAWKGLTAKEVQEFHAPRLSIENIRAYARNHKITLKSPGRGRPPKNNTKES